MRARMLSAALARSAVAESAYVHTSALPRRRRRLASVRRTAFCTPPIVTGSWLLVGDDRRSPSCRLHTATRLFLLLTMTVNATVWAHSGQNATLMEIAGAELVSVAPNVTTAFLVSGDFTSSLWDSSLANRADVRRSGRRAPTASSPLEDASAGGAPAATDVSDARPISS